MTINPNSQDLGGGSDGKRGPISDGAPPSIINVNANRSQFNGGARPTFNERYSPSLLPGQVTQDRINALQLIIVAVFNETLTCRVIDDSLNVGETNIIVAKPRHLRPSGYETDGDFLAIESLTASTRQVTFKYPNSTNPNTTEAIHLEQISPSYEATTLNDDGSIDTLGSVIWASLAQSSGNTASRGLIDLNIEARHWEDVEPEFAYFVIDSIEKEGYQCYKWDHTESKAIVPEDSSHIAVAKPIELRGSYWAGKTINGISYTTASTLDTDNYDTRTGSNGNSLQDETQDVIPVWRGNISGNDITIIFARFVPEGTGTGINGVQHMWQDMNLAGRAFALRFA